MLISGILLSISFLGCSNQYDATGYNKAQGIYVRTASGRNVLVQEEETEYRYIFLNNRTDNENAFEELETGEEIDIRYTVFKKEEVSYSADVFAYWKVRNAQEDSISQQDISAVEDLDRQYDELINGSIPKFV